MLRGDYLNFLLISLFVLVLVVILVSYICYRIAFFAPRAEGKHDLIETPKGEIYDPFREDMVKWTRDVRSMDHEEFSIISFDGLKLCGKFYEYAFGAPIELMFHGYRGTAERDLSGGVQRCFKLGRSALIVDQRCSKNSEGHVITFGINEHQDCLKWVEFMVGHFGPDVKIILTGISMGASTVLMAAGRELPDNVIGVLADCGFNSAKDIIYKVIQKMGLPPVLVYPFVKLGARIFGNFDLDTYSAEEAMKSCTVPVIFFHGEDDDFVPCEMSRINYNSCASRKELVLIPGAGHGLSYPVDPERYLTSLRDFFGPEASYSEAVHF